MDQFLIRKARKDEWESVYALYKNEGLLEQFKDLLYHLQTEFGEINSRRVIWVAFDGEALIGTVTLILDSGEKDLADGQDIGLVKRLRVAEKYHGKGIASLLHEALLTEAIDRRLTKLTLEVAKINDHAIGIYNHWGYAYLRDGYFSDEMVLVKDL